MGELGYFDHPYNRTRENERAIEIPLALEFIVSHHGPGLEVGNVLGNYLTPHWTVVDLFERAPHVLNVDITEYDPIVRFGWVVAISTLEHVGWDAGPPDPPKALRALGRLRSLLTSEGALFVTIPTGWNAYLDGHLPTLAEIATRHAFYARNPDGTWSEAELEPLAYDHTIPSATGLLVAEYGP